MSRLNTCPMDTTRPADAVGVDVVAQMVDGVAVWNCPKLLDVDDSVSVVALAILRRPGVALAIALTFRDDARMRKDHAVWFSPRVARPRRCGDGMAACGEERRSHLRHVLGQRLASLDPGLAQVGPA